MISSGNANIAFTQAGFSNWKIAAEKKKGFTKPETSASHQEAVVRYVTTPAEVTADVCELMSMQRQGKKLESVVGNSS